MPIEYLETQIILRENSRWPSTNIQLKSLAISVVLIAFALYDFSDANGKTLRIFVIAFGLLMMWAPLKNLVNIHKPPMLSIILDPSEIQIYNQSAKRPLLNIPKDQIMGYSFREANQNNMLVNFSFVMLIKNMLPNVFLISNYEPDVKRRKSVLESLAGFFSLHYNIKKPIDIDLLEQELVKMKEKQQNPSNSVV